MSETIKVKFGDGQLTMHNGPPVGDGPFMVWDACNVFMRWLVGDDAFEIPGGNLYGHRSHYVAHLPIETAPIAVAAVELLPWVEQRRGTSETGPARRKERWVASRCYPGNREPWAVQYGDGSIATRTDEEIDKWHTTVEILNPSRIAELEREVERLENENQRLTGNAVSNAMELSKMNLDSKLCYLINRLCPLPSAAQNVAGVEASSNAV